MNLILLAMSVLRYKHYYCLAFFHNLSCITSHLIFFLIFFYHQQTPLVLEINTRKSKLRDLVDRIVKAKLGMNLPLIMHGNSLLYEVGDDLDDIMVANYNANLEKVWP